MPRKTPSGLCHPGNPVRVPHDRNPFDFIKEFEHPDKLIPWMDDLGRIWIRSTKELCDRTFYTELTQKLAETFPILANGRVNELSPERLISYARSLFIRRPERLRLL